MWGGGGGDLNAPLIEYGDLENPVLPRSVMGKKGRFVNFSPSPSPSPPPPS